MLQAQQVPQVPRELPVQQALQDRPDPQAPLLQVQRVPQDIQEQQARREQRVQQEPPERQGLREQQERQARL